VEDDTGATATSDELTIYVDSIADAPDAKFLAYVDGTEVSFQNNSFIDTENGAEIAGIYWDFDLDYDSDGNAVKDDDYDSSEENPEYSYDDYGQYRVRMTIVDSMGQKDSVEQTITVSNSAPPTANFSFTVDAKDVTFKNSSSVDEENGAEIREYIWDFDSESEDDVNSSRTHPSYEYEDYGVYSVKLTVVDTLGKTDSVTKTVEVESPIQGLQALLTSAPVPNEDGQIEADSDPLAVTFYYSSEGGDGDYFTYRFDNNIFYDSDGDGVKENDIDYQTNEPGTWKVTYYESYGQIVAQLTVIDQTTGEEDSATLQVVFEGTLGSANLLAMTPNTFIMFILCALAAVLFGVSFTYQSKPISK
jgi:PKD repeat protein